MIKRPDVPPGCHLIAKDRVGSTNEDAKSLAADGAPNLTVVWAGEQTAGRGRHGRNWDSPRGNLYLSILLRPECAVVEAPQIGFVVGAAMARAVREVAKADVELKWPNDLVLDGQKLSGILLESAAKADGALDWVIAGIGVNVGRQPDLPGTVSLCTAGYDVAVETLLTGFLLHFVDLLAVWEREGFAPIRETWSAFALMQGTELSVKLPAGERLGTFAGLDARGNLMLMVDGITEHIAVGDVFPLSTDPQGEGVGET